MSGGQVLAYTGDWKLGAILAWVTDVARDIGCEHRGEIESAAEEAIGTLLEVVDIPYVPELLEKRIDARLKRLAMRLVDDVLDQICGEDAD